MASSPPVTVVGSSPASESLRVELSRRGFDPSLVREIPTPDSIGGQRAVVVDVDGQDIDAVVRAIRDLRAGSELVVVVIGTDLAPVRRIELLAAGADDAVLKPVVVDELALRIRGVLRRSETVGTEPNDEIGQLVLDPESLQVDCGDRTIRLRHREFELLRYLGRRAGQIVDRGQLMADVWGQPRGNDGTLTVHVNRLRTHLAALGCDQVEVETVHGRGYRLRVCD